MNPTNQTQPTQMNESQMMTIQKKFICAECKNEVDLSDKIYKVNDVVECPFCGIEYKILQVTETGEYALELMQEEK